MKNKIWSFQCDNLKGNFLRAAVDTVLLYGSTTWILIKQHEAGLNRTYKNDQIHFKHQLETTLPSNSTSIRERRMQFAGHSLRIKEELVSAVLLWKPNYGRTFVGRLAKT